MDVLVAAVISALMPVVYERLKARWWFPFIQRGRPLLNTITALVTAFATATGVAWQFDADAGTFMLTGLLPDAIVRSLLLFVLTLATQEGVYRGLIDRPRPAPLRSRRRE